MRQGQISQYTVSGVSAMQVLPASETRARIYFSVDSGTVYLTDRPNPTPGDGVPVTPTSPWSMDRQTYGDMVHHSWFATVLTGSVRLGVVDVQQSGQSDQSYAQVGG